MTKGYQFICNQRDWCGMKEHDSHEHLGAEYVLASDYAALESERDELKRRCELYEARERADNETLHEFADYLSDKRAIAEGRDNG